MNPICPYCQKISRLESTKKIYHGVDYGLAYICQDYPKCDSYVGVHEGTRKSKGSMANGELRNLRKKVHRNFDPFWDKRGGSRNRSYTWLANSMRIPKEMCHIGMFNLHQCNEALEIIQRRRS